MKTINIKTDFGEFDAGNAERIKLFVNKIDIGNSPQVTLSFQHCITDYPATSLIVDKIISQLKSITGPKSLIVQTELDDLMIIILNSLLHGSVELGLKDAPGLIEEKEIQDAVSEHLTKNQIAIKIERIDHNGDSAQTYYEK
jgi:hypothetical protein